MVVFAARWASSEVDWPRIWNARLDDPYALTWTPFPVDISGSRTPCTVRSVEHPRLDEMPRLPAVERCFVYIDKVASTLALIVTRLCLHLGLLREAFPLDLSPDCTEYEVALKPIHKNKMNHTTKYISSYTTAVLGALVAVLALRVLFIRISHARSAHTRGCKPAPIRPYRYPFAIDILQRSIKAERENNTQNDDWAIYEEMGRRSTWHQQILGNWHYVTNDPMNIQAMLATQFKDFELGPIRRGSFRPLTGDGIFTLDGKGW